MNEESKNYRERVLEAIEGFASPSDQLKYERDVPVANVPAELICGFVDDLYHPKSELFLDAFTEQELKSLAELYGMLCIVSRTITELDSCSVHDIQKVPEWRAVITFAKDLIVELKREG